MGEGWREWLFRQLRRWRWRQRERRWVRRTLPLPRNLLRARWREIALRLFREADRDDLFLLAAAVAFFSFLSLFPALSLFASIYGLVADPIDVNQQLDAVRSVLPPGGRDLIENQLLAIAESPANSLGLGIVLSALFGLWSAMQGGRALIQACNRVYRGSERRSLLSLNLLALALTLFALIYATIAVLLLVLVPTLFRLLPNAALLGWLSGAVRWPLLAVLLMAFLALVYRYAPSRVSQDPHWVSWGSAFATSLWLGISALFSLYVANFGRFNQTYGALSGVAVTLFWLYLSALAVLLGAELNAVLGAVAQKQLAAANVPAVTPAIPPVDAPAVGDDAGP